MAKNEFLPFGTATNANVLSNAEYQSLAARSTGFTSGVAKSKELNTAWRQSSVISSVVAQFIADNSGRDVIDDGKTEVLLTNFYAALNKLFLQTGNNLSEIKAAGPDAVVAAKENLGLTNVLVGPLAQATGASTTAIMSQKATTDALATKQPKGNYADSAIFASSQAESYVFNPNKNLCFLINNTNITGAYSTQFGLIWGFDGGGVMTAGSVPVSRISGLSQTTGNSTSAIMSQKAVTDAIGQNASIGLYQLWHDVTASRTVGLKYVNNSNRPIVVAMNVKSVPAGLYASSIIVQGIEFSTGSTTAGEHRFISAIVPPGQAYTYNPLATSNYILLELY